MLVRFAFRVTIGLLSLLDASNMEGWVECKLQGSVSLEWENINYNKLNIVRRPACDDVTAAAIAVRLDRVDGRALWHRDS